MKYYVPQDLINALVFTNKLAIGNTSETKEYTTFIVVGDLGEYLFEALPELEVDFKVAVPKE